MFIYYTQSHICHRYLYIYLSMYMSICLSIYLFISILFTQSLVSHVPIYLSAYLSISLYICTHISIKCLSIVCTQSLMSQGIHLSIYFYVYLSIYLSRDSHVTIYFSACLYRIHIIHISICIFLLSSHVQPYMYYKHIKTCKL